MYNYISISGTIGAGKTALAKKYSERIKGKLMLEEFSSNSFLEKFYKQPKRYAFPLEISFLFERFQQQKIEFSRQDLFERIYISDYIFDKSLLFARLNLEDDQYKVFYNLYKAFEEQLPKPDLIVYLHRPVEVLLQNIKKRNRLFEMEISNDYLENIQNLYIQYFKTMYDKVILILQLNDLNFIENEEIFIKIADLIEHDEKHEKGVNIIKI